MGKQVLVISTSLRANSNSAKLAAAFAKGARNAGNGVMEISLIGKQISFCRGCLACLKSGRCLIPDDAPKITEQIRTAQVICFATPIYYYEMSGQMKTLLDRSNSLYNADYAFRDIYLLTASAEPEDSASDGAVHGLEGWIACFEKARLAGVVRGGGATVPGDMEKLPGKLEETYQMGASI